MVVSDAHVFPGFLTPVLKQLFFPQASAEVRGENTPERKFASTMDQTHIHQVMSLTRSPLSHPHGALLFQQSFLSYKNQNLCFEFHTMNFEK